MSMSPAALADLVKAHQGPIKKFLKRKGASPSLVDDLAQDLWLRLWRLAGLAEIDQPHSYLFRSAANVLHSHFAAACNRKPHEPIENFLDELLEQHTVEDGALDAETCLVVRDAVGRLTARQRQYLNMHVDGMTYKAIAEANGVTYRLVLRELTRAYAALRNDPVLLELRT